MHQPKRIGPQQPTSSGAHSGLLAISTRDIPDDLLQEASKRLSIMSGVAAVLWLVGTVMWHLTWPAFHPGAGFAPWAVPDWIAIGGGLTSVAFCFHITRSSKSPETKLNIGLVYMIVTGLAINLIMHWGMANSDATDQAVAGQIGWTGVMLLIFSAIVPTAPSKMLATGLIAAAMSPVSMALLTYHGLSVAESLKMGLLMHYNDFLLAGVAAVISSVVTRLGQQVSRAREMGSYQIGALIKRGGMGEIYRATHRMLARPAAIKLIRPEMLAANGEDSGDLALKRFRREAEAAANLRSPHTVELFDFGVTEDGTLYFVMELLDGMDLESLVRQHGPMPSARVVHVLQQACESLAEAHSQGLVHRDIKPANIHLGRVGVRSDFVKVLDFGLVKSIKTEETGESLATAVGRTPGTPAYMAPEMAVGEQTDARADIYALGCVGYFLLTGKLVFEAENTFQMIAKHLRNHPVPPSVRAGIDVPRGLEEIILSCLAKNPDERPSSALDMLDSLSNLRIPSWPEKQAADWWTTRQQPLMGASPVQ